MKNVWEVFIFENSINLGHIKLTKYKIYQVTVELLLVLPEKRIIPNNFIIPVFSQHCFTFFHNMFDPDSDKDGKHCQLFLLLLFSFLDCYHFIQIKINDMIMRDYKRR